MTGVCTVKPPTFTVHEHGQKILTAAIFNYLILGSASQRFD